MQGVVETQDHGSARQQVADFWTINRDGRNGPRPTAWLTHPTTQAWLHRRITGSPTVSTIEWITQAFFPQRVARVLNLGCGHGAFDRALLVDIAEQVVAVDVSGGAVEQARAAARKEGVADRIDYRVASLNEIKLPPRSFDAIFGISSIHHVERLEHLFAQCRGALKPGALLFLDEYVGPSRFQSDPKVFAIMNRVLALLPVRYRCKLFADDTSIVDSLYPMPRGHFERTDLSEAIRSGEIIAALTRSFDLVELRPYGGAIMHLLLSGIAGNFDEKCEQDTMFLTLLATLEDVLEDHGVIGSDFAVIVARPKLRWSFFTDAGWKPRG
jgi:SAM-dependent methyltransferase